MESNIKIRKVVGADRLTVLKENEDTVEQLVELLHDLKGDVGALSEVIGYANALLQATIVENATK